MLWHRGFFVYWARLDLLFTTDGSCLCEYALVRQNAGNNACIADAVGIR